MFAFLNSIFSLSCRHYDIDSAALLFVLKQQMKESKK